LRPVTITDLTKWPSALDLDKTIHGFASRPNVIPSLVVQLQLQLGNGGVVFNGSIVSNSAGDDTHVPIFYINEIDFYAGYQWASSKNDSSLDASISVSAFLEPPPGYPYWMATNINGTIAYDSNTGWYLHAQVQNLFAVNLLQFFDKDIGATAMSLIDTIVLENLDVTYQYTSGPKALPSSFTMNAAMLIGSIRFQLFYEHKGKAAGADGTWTFSASVSIEENPSDTVHTLGGVLASILGDDAASEMPSFVQNITFSIDLSRDKLGLYMIPVTTANGTSLFFTIYFNIGDVRFQYIQYRDVPPPTENASDPPPPLKRIFIASLVADTDFSVPLIGDLPALPFDEAFFMWVQPQTGSDGLTFADIKFINAQIDALNVAQTLDLKHLLYKKVKTEPPPSATVVVQNGMHLALVLLDDQKNPTIVLDYAFDNGTPAQTPTTSKDSLTAKTGALVPAGKGAGVKDDPTPAPAPAGGAQMAAYGKSFGPLAIKNLGFKFTKGADKDPDIISLKVDALVTLGPIGFELIGFRLDLAFPQDATSGFSMWNLPTPSVTLDGLAGSFSDPPLSMAGLFEHVHETVPDGSGTKTIDFYEGAISVGFVPYGFQAVGYYGTTTTPTDSFTSAFVYFMLEGPLITLEFAQITGVTGGFGYNTNLRFPDATSVQNFPLITPPLPDPNAPTGSGPLGALSALLNSPQPWFMSQHGSFWVAAGLTVEAFEILNATAVVAVEWDPNVKLGIFGVVTADIPASVGGRAYAHIQFGIVAVVDFGAGTMKIDGQLTPYSYIFDPSCHLTGGFALYNWFGSQDSTLKGDWVFTVGGYHPAYQVPPHYPNPPRLAISWQFNDNISIRGQAYFAITPKCCMGGGRLDLTLSLGPLGAWFDAYADFLINYKPFHFMAEGGLSVGVSFTLDLWIVTIHINIEIGATLFIAGPPLYGTVHVDFWVFGFDINFGSDDSNKTALLLMDFIGLVCQADVSSFNAAKMLESAPADDKPAAGRIEELEDDADADTESDPVAHVFAVVDGLIPLNDSKSTPSQSTTPWKVRAATFAFSISCKFAIQSATIYTMIDNEPVPSQVPGAVDSKGNPVPIFAKPMQGNADQLSTTLNVYISADTTSLALTNDPPKDPVWNNNAGIFKELPLAVWGECKPNPTRPYLPFYPPKN
jgi:hypothetical protein